MGRSGALAKSETANRAVLYLRQSTHRDDSISLELQETACRAYCKQRGYNVVGVYSDEGRSGRFWFTRPGVLDAMRDLEMHRADAIVLWKWSRLSRDRLNFASAIQEAEAFGGRIESATEPIDEASSTGRLTRGFLSEIANWESDRIAEGWKSAHKRRTSLGLPANGKERFGYRYDRKAKHHEQDPITGPVLAECYRLYVEESKSIYWLVGWLNDQGIRTAAGYSRKDPETGEPESDGLWSGRTLRRVMDSGFAAGHITVDGELLPGKHEALIDDTTWKAYQHRRAGTRVNRRAERSPYLLSGLVRCSCGSSMTGGQFGAYRKPSYRCKAGHEKRTHAGGYVLTHLVEEAVHGWLVERNGRLLAERASLLPVGKRDSDTILMAIAKTEERADKLTLRYLDNEISRERHDSLSTRFADELVTLRAQLLAAEVAEHNAEPIVLPSLVAEWDNLQVEQRRGVLQHLIDHVEVDRVDGACIITVHPRLRLEVRHPLKFAVEAD